ncbi:MAG: Crp/Fnr family transcriptional regulator [Limnohabitans sp.]|nr:Crp/Fnr family transcriptional regulator [Limnohabitans sp.]
MGCKSALVLDSDKHKIDKLVSLYKTEFFKKDDYVFVDGDIFANKYVFILVSGTVAYFYENDNQRNYLFSLNSKEARVINSLNLFSLSDIGFSIKAMEDCEIIMIPKIDFLENKVFLNFFRQLDIAIGVIFDKMISAYSCLSNESLETVVYNYLLHIYISDNSEKDIIISRNELSLDLGYSREAISRALRKLEKEGKIIRKTRSIELVLN